jgi:superfamily II DNA/RNA helicase
LTHAFDGRPLLKENPDVVIGTPGKIFAHLQAKNLVVKDTLEMLVLDEADLLFSFGYERDVQNIKQYLPEACQVLLTSATISEEIVKLKKLFLHNPVRTSFPHLIAPLLSISRNMDNLFRKIRTNCDRKNLMIFFS